jgi:putative restriction endonuclease
VLHHKLFDLGAFTLNRRGTLVVSDQAHGTTGFAETLLRYQGITVRPQRTAWKPDPAHLDWHGREVFKGKARQLTLPGPQR